MQYSLSNLTGDSHRNGHCISLSIRGYGESTTVDLPDVLAIPSLPVLKDSIPSRFDCERFTHLDGIRFPEWTDRRVDLLIGADVRLAHKQCQTRTGKEGEPEAIKTALGWTLVGRAGCRSTLTDCRLVNFIRSDNAVIHNQIMRMFAHDFVEDQDAGRIVMSVEDRQALAIMEDSLRREDGHYVISLPRRTKDTRLPVNRAMAEKRLQCLRQRLAKDKELFDKYSAKNNDYIDCGHARKVPTDMLKDGNRTWYIPHHATGGKFRVVFDCVASYKGCSSNRQLLQGPDHTSNLMGVLLRFRKNPVAVLADIEGMFHQVRVTPSDCDSLLFLWWPGKDLDKPPQDYQMMVHLFGATSSPSCCGYALRRVAQDNRLGMGENILYTIRRSFYVDDWLQSFNTSEDAAKTVKDLRVLLAESGFRLTKFVSNHQDSLSLVPEVDKLTTSVLIW